MQLTKYNWLNLLPFSKMSSTVSLRSVMKIVIIIFFVPSACHVLGMTSVGDRINILRTDRNIGTKTHHLLRFLQHDFIPSHVEFVSSLLPLQHKQLFGQGVENGEPTPRDFSLSALSEDIPSPSARSSGSAAQVLRHW
jgi:hypothetical protein